MITLSKQKQITLLGEPEPVKKSQIAKPNRHKYDQGLLTGGTIAEAKQVEEGISMLVDALTSPITVWPGYEDVTQAQKEKVTIAKLIQAMEHTRQGKKITEATDYEAMLYISTASLAQPLDNDWYNIFAFLFRKLYPEQAKEIFGDHEGVKLDYSEESELKHFKEWLYKNAHKRHP